MVHFTIDYTPFEIFYSFNHLTPLDLLPWPIDKMVSFDEKKNTCSKGSSWECKRTSNMHSKLIKSKKELFLTRWLSFNAYVKGKISWTKKI
jgi:hypothetical protein